MKPEVEWFVRRRDARLAQQTQDAFQTWLVANPHNAVHYGQCELVWERVAELGGDTQVQEWLHAADMRVNQASGSRQAPARARRFSGLRWAMAAGVLLAVGVAVFGIRYFNAPVYQTGPGEQRDVRLPDGSHVTLNTATRIVVHYDNAHRRIELTAGEALFDVRKDPARPFEVLAGAGIARAVGTKFSIEQTRDRITISVLEGIVQLLSRDGETDSGSVSSGGRLLPALEGGQSVSLTAAGQLSAVAPANTRRIQAWQDRKLDFESTPLAEAIAEVNRYTVHPLVLGQPQLADLKISGVFHITALDGFTFALQRSFGLRVVENGDELLVLPKQPGEAIGN